MQSIAWDSMYLMEIEYALALLIKLPKYGIQSLGDCYQLTQAIKDKLLLFHLTPMAY